MKKSIHHNEIKTVEVGERCLLLSIVLRAQKDARRKGRTPHARQRQADAADWLSNGPARRVADLLGYPLDVFAGLVDG